MTWLLQSKEAGAIKRKEVKQSRVTELELPDIKEVREKTGLSQNEFAARLHIRPPYPAKLGTGTRRYPNWTSSYIDSNFRCSPKPYLKKLLKKWELKAPIFCVIHQLKCLCDKPFKMSCF